MLKDIAPGSQDSILWNAAGFVEAGGAAYFSTDHSELWKTDGTEAGTELVKDTGAGPFALRGLNNVDDTLYFSASGNTNAFGLWKSDGTQAAP
jgi:ELWxxDGT repeat protein